MKTTPLLLAVHPESQADLPASCLTHLASHRTPVISVPLPKLLFPASWAASDNVHPRTSANSPVSFFICFILLDSGIKRPATSEIREVNGSYKAVFGEESEQSSGERLPRMNGGASPAWMFRLRAPMAHD